MHGKKKQIGTQFHLCPHITTKEWGSNSDIVRICQFHPNNETQNTNIPFAVKLSFDEL